jgi:hypothetical protein
MVNDVLPDEQGGTDSDNGVTDRTGTPEPAWVTEMVTGLPVAPGAVTVMVPVRTAQVVLAL